MSLPIEPIVALYSYGLAPIPALAALGLPVSTLDLIGILRLALVVQQIKYSLRVRTSKQGEAEVDGSSNEKESAKEVLKKVQPSDVDTALSNIWTMLVIVYGGEFFLSSFISQPPSFFLSPNGPLLITLGHFAVQLGLTYVPQLMPIEPSLKWELPLALVDGLNRAVLLCSIGPPAILGHKSATISDSATALLLTSTLMVNGGFIVVETFGMLSPSGWAVNTPSILQPYGWASLDLVSAPLITGLFAALTQSQSTWKNASAYATTAFNATTGETINEKPVTVGFDQEHARAICAIILVGLFGGRAVRNFGGVPALKQLFATGPKLKTQ